MWVSRVLNSRVLNSKINNPSICFGNYATCQKADLDTRQHGSIPPHAETADKPRRRYLGGKQVISKADNLLLWSSLSKVSVTGAQKPPNEGLAFLRVNCETKQMRRNFRSYLTAHGWLSGCYIRSIYPTNTSQIIMCHRSTTKIICFCFPCSSIKKLIDSY